MANLSGQLRPGMGFLLPVSVSPPNLCVLGKPLPPSTVKTVALIDTGTKKTCLATKLIQKLGLPRSQSSIDFQSAMYHGPAQVHFIDFILPFNGTSHIFPHLEVLEISFDAGDIEVLLGLDILCQGIFIINADKSFSFAL